MLPRGYTGRVARFIAWVILLIAGAWGALQISRIFHADVKEDTAFRDAHLYLCDCVDNGNHAELEYHQSTCGYAAWWEEYQRKYGGA